MSLLITLAAWEANITPDEKLVLLAIAERSAGDDEQKIWRREDDAIARLTNLDQDRIGRAVRGLMDRGALLEHHELPWGPGEYHEVWPWDLPGVETYPLALRPRTSDPVRPAPIDRSGYVYLIRGGGYYKIGKARDLDARIKWFEIKLPFEVELVLSIRSEDYSALERELHTAFEHKRTNGEWFALTEEDVAWIEERFGGEP